MNEIESFLNYCVSNLKERREYAIMFGGRFWFKALYDVLFCMYLVYLSCDQMMFERSNFKV